MSEFAMIRVPKSTHTRLTGIVGREIAEKQRFLRYSDVIDSLIDDYEEKHKIKPN